MSAVYRIGSAPVPDAPIPHRGPRHHCPACAEPLRQSYVDHAGKPIVGMQDLWRSLGTQPRFCGPTERAVAGYRPRRWPLGWLLGPVPVLCAVEGSHLHQTCAVCHAMWRCALVKEKA